MRTSTGLVLLAGLLPLLVAAGSGADRITGYISNSGSWTLGSSVDELDLEGFSLAFEREDEREECWVDSSRTIQFGGVDTDVQVRLYFEDGVLDLLTIEVPLAVKSFESLQQYYTKRYAVFECIGSGANYSRWIDGHGRALSLAVVDAEDLGTITSINYWLHWGSPAGEQDS